MQYHDAVYNFSHLVIHLGLQSGTQIPIIFTCYFGLIQYVLDSLPPAGQPQGGGVYTMVTVRRRRAVQSTASNKHDQYGVRYHGQVRQ